MYGKRGLQWLFINVTCCFTKITSDLVALSDIFFCLLILSHITFTDGATKTYVDSKTGLYPKPLARNAKPALVNKVKGKFKFIGKLLAKALMDSRILDLPLNPIVYCWLLGQQKTLTPSDLAIFDQTTAMSYSQIKALSDQIAAIRSNRNLVSSTMSVANSVTELWL